MPSKHINDEIWKQVERKTVKAIMETQQPIKDTQMLNKLVEIGLKHIDKKDYKDMMRE